MNGGVFDIYVFDFTNADAEQPGADDELIVFIGEIAHRMALSVEGAQEQGGAVLHVVHIADGRPVHAGHVQIGGQHEIRAHRAHIAALAASFTVATR